MEQEDHSHSLLQRREAATTPLLAYEAPGSRQGGGGRRGNGRRATTTASSTVTAAALRRPGRRLPRFAAAAPFTAWSLSAAAQASLGAAAVAAFSLLPLGAHAASDDDDDDDEPSICEVGGSGLAFPVGDENKWPMGVRIVLYFLGLVYMFLGVSIIADLFMEAIEVITSKEKEGTMVINGEKVTYTYKVWNATVANLTLMALGSSAPEILLNVIEITSGSFFSGALGPSTIVGSAAFNLLVILAVCCTALPDGEGRRIEEPSVFAVTACTSVFAYLWILVILQGSSPDVVESWEGILTFLFFPLLVLAAYAADQGWCRKKAVVTPDDAALASKMTRLKFSSTLSPKQCKELMHEVRESLGDNVSGEKADEMIKILALRMVKPSRAAMRINAVRSMTGGKRVVSKRVMKTAAQVMAEHGGGDGDKGQHAPPFVAFKSDVYMVSEGDGQLAAHVVRSHAVGRCTVGFESVGGTATPDVDYRSVKDRLCFKDGELMKTITVEIIDDDEVEEDEYFTLRLLEPTDCVLGDWHECTAIIIDDDEPGDLGFDENMRELQALESKGFVEIIVRRFNGSKGQVSCKYKTEECKGAAHPARPGSDYVHSEGTVVFEPQQMQQTIKIDILDDDKYERDEVFKVVLFDAVGPTPDVEIYRDPDDPSKVHGECVVTIVSDDQAKAVGDKVTAALAAAADKYKIGYEGSWSAQFLGALEVHADEDEDGNEVAPGAADYAMHYLTLPFKLVFALVPPSGWYDGWLCFYIALIFIGAVTALIQDLAMLFGCSVGLQDSVTAITFVALGTSLPDTFASKSATVVDETADAAIGNVTGSNCVNVFLGLGLPWMIAALYWEANGPNKAWTDRYGDHLGNAGSDATAPNLGKTYLSSDGASFKAGGFAVPAGSLGFSVTVFTLCSLTCFAILVYRRHKFGYELGGPKAEAKQTAYVLCALWFLYVLLSSLEAYGHFD